MIKELQDKINTEKDKVNFWLDRQRSILIKKGLPLPIYSSFDLRDANFKLAIVDSNLFPAGFNNLGHTARQKSVKSFRDYISNNFRHKDILIIPEAHTRNTYYLSNLCGLTCLLKKAGFNVTIGSLREDIVGESICDEDSSGHKIVLEKMERIGQKIQTKSFKDGIILLNNDFSVRNPELLDNVDQTIIPPLSLSWTHRKKSSHFKYVDQLTDDFADELDIDPWLLKTIHTEASNINFKEKETLELVSRAVDDTIARVQEKYDEHGIKEDPFVFVKDNSGTYGMGVLYVSSGDEILRLNSDKRRKMLFGKQKSIINSVLIQEGVPTIHKVQNHPAEPVLYSVGGNIVGGFMRVHAEKDIKSSLNSPGMKFDILLEDNITKPLIDHITDDQDLSIYGIIADIANLAIAYEHTDVEK